MQGGKVKPVLNLDTKYHKGCHPADGVAHAAFPKGQCQDCDQRDNAEIDHQSGKAGSRNSMIGHIKEINGMNTACRKKGSGNTQQPKDPDNIFEPVELFVFYRFISYGKAAFLQASCGTEPSAEGTAKEKGKEKQTGKGQEASCNNPGSASLNN